MSESKPKPPKPPQPPASARAGDAGAKQKAPVTKKTAPPPAAKPLDESPPRKADPGGGTAALWLSLLALAASIGLAVAAFFFWNQQQHIRQVQDTMLSRVDDKLAEVDATVGRVKAAFEDLKSDAGRHQDVLKQKLDELEDAQRTQAQRLDSLSAVVGRSRQDWSLAEVEYLLRVASDRVQLQRDVKTALIALQGADTRLRELSDPRFAVVREQIAKQREALQRLPRIDREGLAASLAALLNQLDSLPLRGNSVKTAVAAAGSGTATGAAGDAVDKVSLDWTSWQDWKRLPGVIGSALRDLVTIREHDQPVQPMVPPDSEYFLRHNLRLQLEAARVALLREDAVFYRQTLDTARDWLQQYYETQDSAVSATLEHIDELASVQIRPAMPDISQALRVLQQQMALSRAEQTQTVAPAAVEANTDSGPAVGAEPTDAAGKTESAQ